MTECKEERESKRGKESEKRGRGGGGGCKKGPEEKDQNGKSHREGESARKRQRGSSV